MSIFDSIFGSRNNDVPLFDPKKNARYCDICAYTFYGYGNVCPKCGKYTPNKIPFDEVEDEGENTIEYHASILGVNTTDSFDTVKQAYRTRIKEYHPDKVAALGRKLQQLAEREAKKINRAYEHFVMLHRE